MLRFVTPITTRFDNLLEAEKAELAKVSGHARTKVLLAILEDKENMANLPKKQIFVGDQATLVVEVYVWHFYADGYLYYFPHNAESEKYNLQTTNISVLRINDILRYIEEHQNDEEEINLDPDWCLLRYDGRRPGNDQWEGDEFLLESTPERMVSILHDRKVFSLNFDHYRNIRIFDGSKWHPVRTFGGIHFTLPCEEISQGQLYMYCLADKL